MSSLVPSPTLLLQETLHQYLTTKPATPPHLLPTLFKLCAAAATHSTLHVALQLHADAIKLPTTTSTSNSILSYYLKTSHLSLALSHFRSSPSKDSITYNTLLHGLLLAQTPSTAAAAFDFFTLARSHRFRPNVATLVLLIQSCWKNAAVSQGLKIHGYVLKTAFLADCCIKNSVLAMYAGFGDVGVAQNVFDEMGARDVVAWSALIGVYAREGCGFLALRLFREMVREGAVEMDGVLMVGVLQACGGVGDVGVGRPVHGVVVRRGFERDVFVANLLVDMYGKCLDVDSARRVFDLMAERNTVSWNSILSGLVHGDRCLEALELLTSMRGEVGTCHDEATLVILLQLCKNLGQAIWCQSVHAVAIRKVFFASMPLWNALLDAYAKCGLVEHALRLFNCMGERNLITWSTVVAGCAHNGRPHEAVACFVAMREAGEKPNSISMLSLLEACANCAEISASRAAHGVAFGSGLASEVDVGNAVLDMYAKCGDLAASRRVFDAMPIRDVLTWNAMIGALGMNGRASDALALLGKMESESIKPNGITMLAVLSACAHGGLVREGLACFERMTRDPLLQPQPEHFSCVVDMLGRAGNLEGAMEMIERMPKGANTGGAAAWSALLSACRSYGDSELGRDVASRVLELEPANSSGYLLSLRMYAKSGLSGDTARMRSLLKEKGVKVMSGYSLVHVGRKAHRFAFWDGSHPERGEVYAMVKLVHWHMKYSKKDYPITYTQH